MIKKLCIAVITSLVTFTMLGSCDQEPVSNKGADGYKFREKEYQNDFVFVRVVVHGTPEELKAAAREHSDPTVDYTNLAAFSLLVKGHPELCEVHMLDPAITYEPEFVGHEFLHCVYGQWHKDNKSR